jgi:hypothetical protein
MEKGGGTGGSNCLKVVGRVYKVVRGRENYGVGQARSVGGGNRLEWKQLWNGEWNGD